MTDTEKDKPPPLPHTTSDERPNQSKDESVPELEPAASEVDEFGLSVKPVRKVEPTRLEEADGEEDTFHDADEAIKASAEDDKTKQRQGVADNDAEELSDGGMKQSSPGAAGILNPPSRLQPDTPDEDPKADDIEEKMNGRQPHAGSSAIRKPVRKREEGVSEWSHQRLAPRTDEDDEDGEEVDWQAMPALGEYDLYDDDGNLVAKGAPQEDAEQAVYGGLGGAGKGYTRVQVDDDAQSATSMDDDTRYLFKEKGTNVVDEEEEQRDAVSQLQATKDLLNEGQKIAYVGVVRLAMFQLVKELKDIEPTKGSKRELVSALENMIKWGQQMMVRLYAHMDINSDEQLMIEQLAEHGVQPVDLALPLMRNSRVKNPMAAEPISPGPSDPSPKLGGNGEKSNSSLPIPSADVPPPPYQEVQDEDLPAVRTPSQMPTTESIELDLRWTVLCDLFLVLIGDLVYDARSRQLLERVGAALDVPWVQICRFEKRVIDALEMQEEAARESWNEDEHMERRAKAALRRRWVVMGLATAGGGLVIGLSAGLLAPLIGAGLAAGFTTVGVTGTGTFLAGAGGVALITTSAATAGSVVGVRAGHRRTGAVKTFEYRPLHNNKQVNLIVTVSGWMNGTLDDVRLPYSTVDPIMGDLYSVYWEPEMLQSMGQTISILATEAFTQGLQQVLGSTILMALMASLQLPIVLSKLAYLIDNPWSVSLGRANSAGLILADSLIDRHLGKRPITLLGFSIGSRLIFSCLKELAERKAYGIVQNVYLFGSPIVAKKDEYLKARSVVSGRFVNGYASNDWILGYLFRATSGGIMRVAGLAPVEGIPGLENLDVTELVNGHMAYRAAMPKLLRKVGWEVTSDKFTEIEDPDPENHAKRQRKLIAELDNARKEAEAKPQKKRFGFFKRGKLADKEGWELHGQKNHGSGARSSTNSFGQQNGSVLFDIEAIRRELHSEQIDMTELESTLPPMQIRSGSTAEVQEEEEEFEVKELVSTLPPMQLNINGQSSINGSRSPRSIFRQTQSSEAVMASETRTEASSSVHSLTNGPVSDSVGLSRPEHDDYNVHETEVDDPEIRMAFDTGFSKPSQSPQPQSFSEPITQKEFSLPRPDLKSHATEPAMPQFNALNFEHNAWADDDDEFGKGKEVKMTFE